MARTPKTYTVETLRRGKTTQYTGTIAELVQTFAYTLECGASWQHGKGSKKVNTNPTTYKALITALRNAAENTRSETSYWAVEQTAQPADEQAAECSTPAAIVEQADEQTAQPAVKRTTDEEAELRARAEKNAITEADITADIIAEAAANLRAEGRTEAAEIVESLAPDNDEQPAVEVVPAAQGNAVVFESIDYSNEIHCTLDGKHIGSVVETQVDGLGLWAAYLPYNSLLAGGFATMSEAVAHLRSYARKAFAIRAGEKNSAIKSCQLWLTDTVPSTLQEVCFIHTTRRPAAQLSLRYPIAAAELGTFLITGQWERTTEYCAAFEPKYTCGAAPDAVFYLFVSYTIAGNGKQCEGVTWHVIGQANGKKIRESVPSEQHAYDIIESYFPLHRYTDLPECNTTTPQTAANELQLPTLY